MYTDSLAIIFIQSTFLNELSTRRQMNCLFTVSMKLSKALPWLYENHENLENWEHMMDILEDKQIDG